MGFQKLIFTDALCMKAIGDEKQAALKALQAGVHILLAAENSLALSDFLQTQKGLEKHIAESIALQKEAACRLSAPIKEGLSAGFFNQKYIADCAVWQGETSPIPADKKIAYLELGNEENLAAHFFIKHLTEKGISILKAGQKSDLLIVVSFSNYKAFKGHINLTAQEKQQLAKYISLYPHILFISFGSPFGIEEMPEIKHKLFLFSPAEEAQIYAAEVVLGKEKPKGNLPVGL